MFFLPINLPKPQQSGYTRKFAPNMLRTQMSDGYVRQRLINQGTPDSVSVTWLFNSEEYSEFLAWYKGNIHSGDRLVRLPFAFLREKRSCLSILQNTKRTVNSKSAFQK